MKWKRSRKAQQESKNKDKDSNDDKRDRNSNSSNHNSTFKSGINEKIISNLAPSSFHFSKKSEVSSHPHPGISIQRHIMQGPSNEILPDENYSNRQHQGNVFSESDDMIWRVV